MTTPYYRRSPEILAGFHAQLPEQELPELFHIGEHWAPRSHFISLHTHHVWEFYMQVNGQCLWDYASVIYTLNPGDFFAVAPQVPHTMHEPPPRTHHYIYAAIDLDIVFTRLPDLAPYWRDQQTIHLPHVEHIQSPFRQLIREVAANTSYRALGMRTALDYLVLEVSRLLVERMEQHPHEASRLSIHPAVSRAKNLLDYQPGAHWQLADLARMVDLSPHHLVECFTRDIGISPHQYLLQVRIERARELLAHSNRAITDLAFELGFSSSQHFASTFKRLTGETAQSYRQARQTNTHLPR